MTVPKTILFEDRCGIPINALESTRDIDEVIEKKIGRKLKIIRDSPLLIRKGGSISPHRSYYIGSAFEKAIHDATE